MNAELELVKMENQRRLMNAKLGRAELEHQGRLVNAELEHVELEHEGILMLESNLRDNHSHLARAMRDASLLQLSEQQHQPHHSFQKIRTERGCESITCSICLVEFNVDTEAICWPMPPIDAPSELMTTHPLYRRLPTHLNTTPLLVPNPVEDLLALEIIINTFSNNYLRCMRENEGSIVNLLVAPIPRKIASSSSYAPPIRSLV